MPEGRSATSRVAGGMVGWSVKGVGGIRQRNFCCAFKGMQAVMKKTWTELRKKSIY